MLRIVLMAAVLSCGRASPSANQYIDTVLNGALPQALRSLGLEPAPLSNFGTWLGNAQAQFSFGNVSGLSRARRLFDCAGPKLFRGELTVNCTLNLSPISTAYRLTILNASRTDVARAIGSVGDTTAAFVISGKAPAYIGSVKTFHAGQVGYIAPNFSNLPAGASKYIATLQNAYRTNVSPQLFNILQQKFVYALGRAISTVPMPRQ